YYIEEWKCMWVWFGGEGGGRVRILNKSSRNCVKKINVVFVKYKEKGKEDRKDEGVVVCRGWVLRNVREVIGGYKEKWKW
uniref:hypothetical protein n=1 Tax=Paenibacillus xylanexedens TaxID=528191 RepID=UPI001C92D205